MVRQEMVRQEMVRQEMAENTTDAEPAPQRDYKTIVWRCLRLRCPACGVGKIFKGWFRMADRCRHCGYDLEREPGFYLGSIYVNYGLTAGILVVVCAPIVLWTQVSTATLTPLALIFCGLFPIWFHRYARSFWLGFDYRWDGFRTARAEQNQHMAAQETGPQSLASEGGVKKTVTAQRARSIPKATCPFCHHREVIAAERRGSWIACPRCGNQMLLAAGGPPPDEAQA